MENQHRKISGYRELSQVEIDLMNRIKAFGPELEKLCDDLHDYLAAQSGAASAVVGGPDGDPAECDRITKAEPWGRLQTGKRDLQTGLMALTRAVAQPGFF